MGKRVLMVATVSSMIGSFNINNIEILLDVGYKVDVACDFTDTSVWPLERIEQFKERLCGLGIECIQLDFSRNPLKIYSHISSYREVLRLFKKKQYSFIHTHTPIASAIVRLAAHKTSTKVIYTAHGFHFYHGAPLKNWIVFYPVEKWLSRYTEVLITINREDYKRAKEKFKAKETVYIPGVGVDTDRFAPSKSGREKIRAELELQASQLMLLSVGELNENKNHEMVIRAIQGLNLVYVIVGKGELEKKLRITAKKCGVDLRLAGFRNDVADFYSAADVYILPSIREGLNVSLMEAMASGLPIACARIRGNVDLIDEGKGGCFFDPKLKDSVSVAIQKAIHSKDIFGVYNEKKIRIFNTHEISNIMRDIYSRW